MQTTNVKSPRQEFKSNYGLMGFLVWNQIHYAKIQKYDYKIKSWVTRSHFSLLGFCFVIQSKPFPLPSTPHYNALQSYCTTILQVFCTKHTRDTNTNTKIHYTNTNTLLFSHYTSLQCFAKPLHHNPTSILYNAQRRHKYKYKNTIHKYRQM